MKIFKSACMIALALVCVLLSACQTMTPDGALEGSGTGASTAGHGNATTELLEDPGNCEHVFGAWEIVTPAQCETRGLQKKRCETCHYVVQEPIVGLCHSYNVNNICEICSKPYEDTGFTFSYAMGGNYAVSNYMGTATEVYVPVKYKGYFVSEIGTEAFWNRTKIQSVVLPRHLTKIGDGAFRGCRALESIVIPERVIGIPNDCFTGCVSLTSLCMGEAIIFVGNNAFGECAGLVEISFDAGTVTVGENAFRGCTALQAVTFHTFDDIGAYAFQGCTALDTLQYDAIGIVRSSAFEGCVSLKEIEIAGRFVFPSAFVGCTSLETVTFKEGVEGINESAFEYCKALKQVTFPNTITQIDAFAFAGCTGITALALPDRLEYISEGCFYGCTALKSLQIPYSCQRIRSNAMNGCTSLEQIVFTGNDIDWWRIELEENWKLGVPATTVRCENKTLELT